VTGCVRFGFISATRVSMDATLEDYEEMTPAANEGVLLRSWKDDHGRRKVHTSLENISSNID